MAKTSEVLTRLEQEAQELVAKLRILNEEIGSYKKAKDSLDVTNESLQSLIKTTEDLAKGSTAIIGKFNAISGASFIEQVKEVNKNIGNQKEALASEHKQLMAAGQALNTNLADLSEQIRACLRDMNKRNQLLLLIIVGAVVIAIGLHIVQMFVLK